VGVFLTHLFATYADILSSARSSKPYDSPSSLNGTLPYRPSFAGKTRSFGSGLEPRYIFGARPLDQ
jgi:hypothetical protein